MKLPLRIGRLSGARNVQLALAHGRLPRLAYEQTPDDLQSCRAIRMVFHPLCPSLSCRSHPSGPHCTTCSFSSLDASMIKKGPLPEQPRTQECALHSTCAKRSQNNVTP